MTTMAAPALYPPVAQDGGRENNGHNMAGVTTTAVTAWLSGGSVGQSYAITCHIVTAAGARMTAR